MENVTKRAKKLSATEPEKAVAHSAKPKPPARVFILDDHPIYTSVLVEVLNDSGELEVVGTAADVPSAVEQIKSIVPDILVLDLMLPGPSGLELLQILQEMGLPTRIVVCSGTPDDQAIEMAFAFGARCFVEKQSPITDLVSVLKRVARDENPISPRAAGVLRDALLRRSHAKKINGRDLEILRRLAMRQCVKEIAAAMELSVAAIYKARSRIATRFGARSAADLHRAAARLGLVLGAHTSAPMPPEQ